MLLRGGSPQVGPAALLVKRRNNSVNRMVAQGGGASQDATAGCTGRLGSGDDRGRSRVQETPQRTRASGRGWRPIGTRAALTGLRQGAACWPAFGLPWPAIRWRRTSRDRDPSGCALGQGAAGVRFMGWIEPLGAEGGRQTHRLRGLRVSSEGTEVHFRGDGSSLPRWPRRAPACRPSDRA